MSHVRNQADALAAVDLEFEVGERDFTVAPPKPSPAMFYGVVGEVARAATKGREPSPVSVALAYLTWMSAAVGSYHYLRIGDKTHPLMLNALHVGRSMVAAKGESWALVRRISAAVSEMMDGDIAQATDEDGGIVTPPRFAGRSHEGGLSTGEGLAFLAHDGFTQGQTEHMPIDDKRLLVIEEEFARVLEQGKRDGNTLSAVLRNVFDGGSIKPATKGGRLWATEPHIVVHGGITPFELRARMDANAAHNGLMNRFLIAFAERTCTVAFPPATPDTAVERLAVNSRDVIKFARGDYPVSKYAVPITLSDEAKAIYETAYHELRRRDGSTPIITSLLERRAPITLRLAGLFALTDQTTVISADHMNAALAWAKFHKESVGFIFGSDMSQRIASEKRREQKEKIISGTQPGRWITRTEINREVFSKRITSPDLTAALEELLADGQLEQREKPKQNGIGTVKEYSRPARDAHKALEGISTASHTMHKSARDAHEGEPFDGDAPLSAHDAQRCQTAETRTSVHVAHDAHVAQCENGNHDAKDEVVI